MENEDVYYTLCYSVFSWLTKLLELETESVDEDIIGQRTKVKREFENGDNLQQTKQISVSYDFVYCGCCPSPIDLHMVEQMEMQLRSEEETQLV